MNTKNIYYEIRWGNGEITSDCGVCHCYCYHDALAAFDALCLKYSRVELYDRNGAVLQMYDSRR
jgi:hypothetical protein